MNNKNIIFSHLILKIKKEKIKAIIHYIYNFNVFKLLYKMQKIKYEMFYREFDIFNRNILANELLKKIVIILKCIYS